MTDKRAELIKMLEALIVDTEWSDVVDLSPEDAKDILGLLKEQEAVEPYMDYDGHDVWRCGNCGAMIFHIEHSQADEDWKSYAKFCRQCGRPVKWK